MNMFAAHLQGAQSQHTEANLARELQTQHQSTVRAKLYNLFYALKTKKGKFFQV
jgi:hypothetical protein